MKIIIETIPHSEQRYPTVGDWFYEWHQGCANCGYVLSSTLETPKDTACNGCGRELNRALVLRIKVSLMPDPRHTQLVAIHELIEVLLCQHSGVSQASVDAFDTDFEKAREAGNDAEPGDDPKAPYVKQHCFATGIERLMAAELGVNWKDYEDELNSLP